MTENLTPTTTPATARTCACGKPLIFAWETRCRLCFVKEAPKAVIRDHRAYWDDVAIERAQEDRMEAEHRHVEEQEREHGSTP